MAPRPPKMFLFEPQQWSFSNLTYGRYNYAPEGNEWYNFNVHENTADDEQTFLIYGDLGVENSQCLDAIENLVGSLADDLDMIWHIGDFAYDMCDNNGQNTDLFMNMVEPIASACKSSAFW